MGSAAGRSGHRSRPGGARVGRPPPFPTGRSAKSGPRPVWSAAGRSATVGYRPAGQRPVGRPPVGLRRIRPVRWLADRAAFNGCGGDENIWPAPLIEDIREALDSGAALYQQFNRFPPRKTERVEHLRLMPPVAVDLGELVGIIYRADKWQPGKPRTYVHFMENRPRLVCDVDGNRLYIVGGSYQVTERGIEG